MPEVWTKFLRLAQIDSSTEYCRKLHFMLSHIEICHTSIRFILDKDIHVAIWLETFVQHGAEQR